MLERHSIASKDKMDSSIGIQKQFDSILARLGDLENVNLRLKEKEKTTMLECRKLEDKVKAAEEAKKLAEEKEIALIRENGRLREKIDLIESENRRIKDEMARGQRGSLSDIKPAADRGYEERRKLMDENEKLVNIITNLTKEKTVLENKVKQNEENSEVRNYFEYKMSKIIGGTGSTAHFWAIHKCVTAK